MKYFLALLASAAGARDLNREYKTNELQVGAAHLEAYIADDEKRRELGLMNIEKMAEGIGMLFVFSEPREQNFWMKNTLIALSIGFFDGCGILIDIQDMRVAPSLMDLSPPTYQSRGPALFALEANLGWFARHHVRAGVRLSLKGKSASALLTKQLSGAQCMRKKSR